MYRECESAPSVYFVSLVNKNKKLILIIKNKIMAVIRLGNSYLVAIAVGGVPMIHLFVADFLLHRFLVFPFRGQGWRGCREPSVVSPQPVLWLALLHTVILWSHVQDQVAPSKRQSRNTDSTILFTQVLNKAAVPGNFLP